MALFVFITEECRNDAKKHNHEQEIENFAERVEREQRSTLFDNFPPPYLKKRFRRQIRLLASERPIAEHTIVCFYRLLVRGSNDYINFLREPRAYGDQNFAPLISDDILNNFVQEKLQQESIPEKPQPNTEEGEYLWNIMAQENVGTDEIFICETDEWVKSIAAKQLDDRLLFMYEAILEAADGLPNENKTYLKDAGGQKGLNILCRYFPKYRKLLLVKPFYKASKNECQDIENQYTALLDAPQENIEDRDILKYSRRSYPNEILVDEDFWMEIERDEEANLALSSEESELLQSVHNQGLNDTAKGFPLFINGRAGSGKSTILLYLFADYLRYYLQDKQNKLRPLYLTCSADLLKRSQIVAYGLIKCNYRSLESNLSDEKWNSMQEEMHDSFQEFHSFLRSLVPLSDRRRLFNQQYFINYGRFQELWKDKFAHDPQAKEQYGPDHSWHVIRSYIKGLSIDGYLDRDEYAVQPKNERTVTQEKFDAIYEKVWNNWYRDLCKPIDDQRRYWDDQDLVRYIIDKNLVEPLYPAIFCDEAQDFTRIELETLLRLSIFSDRKLNPQEINRVPFAFAGDPFQTLNPTGFRWDAIKAAYVLKFIRALDSTHSASIQDLNYRELSFNYRSTRNIVQLCNTIQSLRAALFGIPDLEPQATWLYEKSSPMPVWFDRGASGVMDHLKKQTELTIIVPCDEGGEKEFVQNDEYLNSIVEKDDTGVPQNVLSPSRAKGLEFNRVVLYGFGENAPDKLLNYLDQQNSFTEDPDKALPLEYFINRLYVAASRPKRRLFVIDSRQGLQKLWKSATDADFQKHILKKIKNGEEIWRNHVGILQQGTVNSWKEDRDDPAVVGERYEQDGLTNRDPYLMRQAALAYRGAGNANKATECLAHALLLEKKYEKSGEKFIECENVDKALQAFWEGRNYRRICELNEKFPSVSTPRLEFRMADFLISDPTLATCIQLLKEVQSHFDQSERNSLILNDESWRHALQNAIERVINHCGNGEVTDWKQIVALSDALKEKGAEISEALLANIKYLSQDYRGATVLWEEVGETSSANYRKSKALVLVGLRESGDSQLTEEEKRIAAAHYVSQESYEQAAEIFSELNDVYEIGKLLEKVLQTNQHDDAEKFLKMLLTTMIETGEWNEAVRFLDKRSCRQVGKAFQPKLRSILKKNSEKWYNMFVQKIATSNILVQSSNQAKSSVSRLLKNKYILRPVKSWMGSISPVVVGSAVERAGLNVDGLQFYERVEASADCPNDLKRHAAVRWAVCKNRQIEHEKISGSLPHARKLEEDLQKKLQEIDLDSLNQEPEFPDVTEALQIKKVKPKRPKITKDSLEKKHSENERLRTVSDADRIKWTVEKFDFEFSREQKRVNIENQDSMQTAAILLENKECRSMDFTFSEDQGIFVSESWGLAVDMNYVDTKQVLGISFSELGFTAEIAISP